MPKFHLSNGFSKPLPALARSHHFLILAKSAYRDA